MIRVICEGLVTTFESNETLRAKAELEDTDTVYLRLGTISLLSPQRFR